MHVIATAGHVDHGKSTLVRALTGMEPDRWAEERRRGMTIDLGYAWTTLPNGDVAAFVDVPGHQRFISNMLAGIGPVAAVMFVVAADEGWCRQSGEHLAALQALGVRHGVLAVTRADLGDADLAIEEARSYLQDTTLAGMAAVAVSPVAATGLTELRAALAALVEHLPPPPVTPTRLWIDRCFTIRGAGTVVTGTLGSGRIAVGDELVLAPTSRRVQVRGLQSLKADVTSASAVARLAVNLRGVKIDDVHRGQALVTPGDFAAVSTLDVRLVRPAQRIGSQLILHAGSAAVPVRIRRFDDTHARLSLDRPIPVHMGERALLRDPGEQRIAAGLIVLDTMPPPLRRRGAAAHRAAQMTSMAERPDAAAEIARRGLVRRSDLIAAGVPAPHRRTTTAPVVIGDWYVDAGVWHGWMATLAAELKQWAAANPMAPGMPRAAAARKLGLSDPRLVDALVAATDDLVVDGEGVRHRDVAPSLPDAVSQALDELRQRLAAKPFVVPEAGELSRSGLSDRHLATAVKLGLLLRLDDGVFVLPGTPAEAARRVAGLAQPFTLSEARQALGTTRRVAVPLFELLDRRGLTRRVDAHSRIVCDVADST